MFGDKFNLVGLLKNAKKIQSMMEDAQGELEKVEVHGEAGAGAVEVFMNARHYVKSVKIDKEILNESIDVVQELVAAAMNDAARKAEVITKEKMMDFGKLFGGNLDDDGQA